MNTERPYPPTMPQAPQPVFQVPPPQLYVQSAAPVNEKQKGQKIKIAFYAAVVFVILSQHGVYRVMNTLYASLTSQPFELVNEHGTPTVKGVIIQGVIFFVIAMILLSKYSRL